MLLTIAQFVTVAVWAAVCLTFSPAVYRSFFGKAKSGDEYRSAFFFVGLLFIGFPTRSIIAADSHGARLFLQALAPLLGCYVILISSPRRKKSDV